MKNKVLAALLAVCLFVGLAVPAFAAVNPLDVASVKADKDSVTVAVGYSSVVKLTVKDNNGDDLAVEAPDVAPEVAVDTIAGAAVDVDNDGKASVEIFGIKVGETKVTIDVAGKKVEVAVKVVEAKEPTKIGISGPDSVIVGVEAEYKVVALDGNVDISNYAVTWDKSSNATVAAGKLTASAKGTVILTATITAGGKDITVEKKITAVEAIAATGLSVPAELKVVEGTKEVDLNKVAGITFTADDNKTPNTGKVITWFIEDEVIENGKISAENAKAGDKVVVIAALGEIDDIADAEVMDAMQITIIAKASDTDDKTDVPQTGDALLANLF